MDDRIETAEWTPTGTNDVVITLSAVADQGRLEALLLRSGIPALLIQPPYTFENRLCARVLHDDEGHLLKVSAIDGALLWKPVDPDELARALFDEYGPGVSLGSHVVGVDGDIVVEPSHDDYVPERVYDGGFAWATQEMREYLPLAAAMASQPLGVVESEGHRILTPTRSRREAMDSVAWAFGEGLLMWRDGTRRGIGSTYEDTPLIFAWDDEPRHVSPVGGWERDATGRTVAEYLDEAAHSYDDPRGWAARFALDSDRSESLRIIFRSEGSAPDTLARVAGILGAPAVLAEVAEGRIDPTTLPGHTVVDPASFWHTVRAAVMDEMKIDDGGSLFAWYRFSARHPRWRWVITALAMGGLSAMLVVKIASGDFSTIWLPILGLTIWIIDLSIPRRTIAETPLA